MTKLKEFTNAEREEIFSLAEKLTGNCQQENYRKEVIISNIFRRMSEIKATHLHTYLNEALANSDELSHLMSALTIHTTEWFREMPHFEKIEAYFSGKQKSQQLVKILCTACSTGEEVYSIALLFEKIRRKNNLFNYEISAFDIDPTSADFAKKCIYELKELGKIPADYHSLIRKLNNIDSFTVDELIKLRIKFYTDSLTELKNTGNNFNIITCRNVLIYFKPDKVKLIIQSLLDKLVTGGILIIGHSDSLNAKDFKLKSLGNSMFEKL